jgi:hypothetical protein
MREIIGNFPERARNFHQNISGMWIPGMSGWLSPSLMQDCKAGIFWRGEKNHQERVSGGIS